MPSDELSLTVWWPAGSPGGRAQRARRLGPACLGGWPAWAIHAYEAGRRAAMADRCRHYLDTFPGAVARLGALVEQDIARHRTTATGLDELAREGHAIAVAPCVWVPTDTPGPARNGCGGAP